MTHDMLHVMEWHNGEKPPSPFSDLEMWRRHDDVRQWMAANDVDAGLFTSSQAIAYYSGWFCGGSGRKCGMVVSSTAATTISPAIDGGQPWRQGFHDNISYTDWRRDNFFYALRQLTQRVGRLAIEMDHVTVKFLQQLESALPGVDFVDVGQASMWMRSIKSVEEHDLLRAGARIAAQSATAALELIVPGVLEYEVGLAASASMYRAIAATFPGIALMGCNVLFQSGIHTDGSHNPTTDKRVQPDDVLSLTCAPMLFGYSSTLQRTLFCEHADNASLVIWQKNLTVHQRALDLIRPGVLCSDIARELSDLDRQCDLLKCRLGGYGQTIGLQSNSLGGELEVAIREDCFAELRPGMVISVDPMLMVPDGTPGAGGYRDTDIMIVTETGAERITVFSQGPNDNIICAHTDRENGRQQLKMGR
ncbi:M24 family metallopeptidase [Mesorhizobium sp. NBSH29]|uniref:aminopeptidase P family protein n=1 Tax=Mesorhizobium sp. NBSH29 TaxID=2654249 RepID=UPI001896716D|nr:aminopeptidase P family protein [Mesorhizobium sp. NBSH29]QPC85768.1 M24 family metallopeptidase [Mesorhizobium sp. NBSH29]